MLLLKVDVLLLSFLTNNAEVGLYAAAYRLVEGTQFVAWAFNAAMLPWLARTTGATLARGYMLGLKLLGALLLPVGRSLACFADAIVDLLYGDEFAGAATPLALLGLHARAVRPAVVLGDAADRPRRARHRSSASRARS